MCMLGLKNEDIKNPNLLKHIEKDMSLSNSKSSISNTKHMPKLVADKQTHDHFTDNTKVLIKNREKVRYLS